MQPTPLDPLPKEYQDKRLWIGNLDIHLNEYQLLKILQPLGRIEKFDLLYHRSGPLEGQSRGYAFVTYNSASQALEAKNKLHGKKIGGRNIVVKWANNIKLEEQDVAKALPNITALSGAKPSSSTVSTNAIEAIEAKLKLMENSVIDPDFSETPTLSCKPPTFQRATSQSERRFTGRKRPYKNRRR